MTAKSKAEIQIVVAFCRLDPDASSLKKTV
jgi:hypothetical protein